MVEDHRRVESRQIVGSGMATDPERIQKVADEAARRERAWRPTAETSFDDVIGRAPARGQLADEPPPPEVPAPTTSTSPPLAGTTTAPPPAPPPARPLRTTPRAPDPRQRALMQQLDHQLAAAKTPASVRAPTTTETPPTGTAAPSRPPR